MKAVNIVIRTRQVIQGEVMEFSQDLSGTLEPVEQGLLLRYTEKDENSLSTENVFLLTANHAVLKRSGAVTSEMRFLPEIDSVFPYRTFYGTFDLTLHTDYFRHNLNETGGKVMIRYTLSAQGQLMGEYTLKLHITEKDD